MRKADPELQKRRRDEVLNAAIECFTKHGFHQTSMQNIADASGLSMGLLYRYFANKEAIIAGAALKDRDESVSRIVALRVRSDAALGWATLLLDLVEVASEPNYVRLVNEVIAEASRVPNILRALQESDEAVAAAVAAKLAEQIEQGSAPTLNVIGAAQALLVLFDGLVYRRMISPKSASTLRAKHVTAMVRGVFTAFASTSSR
jgi:TetR/AcrR family transcriptional regulator, repressor for uid operon